MEVGGSRLISVESWERVFQVEARGSSKALRPACHVGVRVNSPMQLEHVKREINTKMGADGRGLVVVGAVRRER